MEVKTEAIVLKTVDYKDNDKLLTLFSPTLGKITAGARGVKKPKAKLAFSAQPFCFAEYVLAEKGGRYTVTAAYLHESFFELRADISRYFAACACAEVCRELSLENERYEGMFIAFIELLKALCMTEEDEAEALISFLLIALSESGYPLDLSYLEECGGDIGEKLWFDFSDGRFTTFERCTAGERASVSTYHTLRKCAGLSYEESALAGGKKRALRLLKAFLLEKTELSFDSLGEFIRMLEDETEKI
ncbi:MAG: DNA repair protein RecO [Clostridia bacterium]|nr:DNA repair protein RecO [Clostridia bacterium]